MGAGNFMGIILVLLVPLLILFVAVYLPWCDRRGIELSKRLRPNEAAAIDAIYARRKTGA